ncbi:MAG: glycosyltransferase family 1 protein [Anaerolineae bacterium]
MQAVLPWEMRQLKPDICHFTNSVAPLLSPCRVVVTIHDMTLWLYARYHHRKRLLSMRPLIPLAARRAAALITVSHSAKADIVRILGTDAAKIHVIHEAPPADFQPLPPGAALEAVRSRYKLPRHFILHVGTLEPRKNLVRLIEVFARLHRAGTIPHSLVFVGANGWKTEPVFEAVARLALHKVVRFLGHVPQDDMAKLYNLADVVTFPSLYEGFGLPVVEAMACGTPVVTSRRGALEEVAGAAAEFVEPTEDDSIAEGLCRVLTDPNRHAELRARGLARAAQFSWAATAAQTMRVYEQVIQA